MADTAVTTEITWYRISSATRRRLARERGEELAASIDSADAPDPIDESDR